VHSRGVRECLAHSEARRPRPGGDVRGIINRSLLFTFNFIDITRVVLIGLRLVEPETAHVRYRLRRRDGQRNTRRATLLLRVFHWPLVLLGEFHRRACIISKNWCVDASTWPCACFPAMTLFTLRNVHLHYFWVWRSVPVQPAEVQRWHWTAGAGGRYCYGGRGGPAAAALQVGAERRRGVAISHRVLLAEPSGRAHWRGFCRRGDSPRNTASSRTSTFHSTSQIAHWPHRTFFRNRPYARRSRRPNRRSRRSPSSTWWSRQQWLRRRRRPLLIFPRRKQKDTVG